MNHHPHKNKQHPAEEKSDSFATFLKKHRRAIEIGLAAGLILVAIFLILQANWTKSPVISGGPDGFLATNTSPTPVAPEPAPVPEPVEYIEVLDSCGPSYAGESCVNVRQDPSTQKPPVAELRKGMVLRVAKEIEVGGKTWYKIAFDEWLRYPDRMKTDWYVAGDFVHPITTFGPEELQKGAKVTSQKRIIVDRSEQMLYAYDGDTLFMKQAVSTGIELTPTPRGTFDIYRKTPTRYMQGPIPGVSDHEYDLPGVPWNLYFTAEGAVIHGAYWHNDFGKVHSNGCVNLPPNKAKELYEWADLGMRVTVQE